MCIRDRLYVIDPFDYEVALRTGKAQAQQRAADLQVKEVQSQRRQRLSSLATTPEEQQTFAGGAVQAKAVFEAAQQQVAQAEINLRRTQVRSPVNGYVTNLLMRVGDFAHEGATNVSVIDTDSYWLDGYFEETKLARICIGDRVEAKLMGYAQPILGHVATVTRGIGVLDGASGTQGLPNVNPIYTWVRLAQRVPVRDRQRSGRHSAGLRHDGDGNGQGCRRVRWPNLARPRGRGDRDSAFRRAGRSAGSAGVHPRNHDRARDAGVTSGGRAEIGAHPGADQPGSRTGHERVAKEQELIRPNDVRFTTAAALRRSPSFPFRIHRVAAARVDPLGARGSEQCAGEPPAGICAGGVT